jgi:hypothetical protein
LVSAPSVRLADYLAGFPVELSCRVVLPGNPDHIRAVSVSFCYQPSHLGGNVLVKKIPFRLSPYQVQWLMVVGFLSIGYALYVRYFAIEFSTVALACDAGLQTMLCKTRALVTSLFRNSVFGVVALIIATLHVTRPSIVLLTGGLIAAAFGIVLYNIALSGLAIGLLILGFARPAPATA